GQRRPSHKFLQRVGKSLDLKKVDASDGPARADDRVAGAHQDRWIRLDRPGAVLKLPGEALVHTAESGLLRLRQVQTGEKPPQPDREVAHHRLLDPAAPDPESGKHASGHAG